MNHARFCQDAEWFASQMPDVGPTDDMFQVPYAAIDYAITQLIDRKLAPIRWIDARKQQPEDRGYYRINWQAGADAWPQGAHAAQYDATMRCFLTEGEPQQTVDIDSTSLLFIFWQPLPAPPTIAEMESAIF